MRHHATLVRVSRDVAVNFMQQHEHLGDLGLGVWHWGLEYCNHIAGIVSYGTTCFSGRRSWIGRLAEIANARVVQLCRGGTVPWAPKGSASFLISLANKSMARMLGPLVIVAYATPDLGEIGTIYQASNATYTGLTRPKSQANYRIGNRVVSGWKVRKDYGTRDRVKLATMIPNLKVLVLRPRHRYVMISGPMATTRQLRRLLKPHALPYPKRGDLGIGSMAGMPGIPSHRSDTWPSPYAIPVP